MQNITAILVDDEQSAMQTLEHELHLNCPEINVLDRAFTVQEAHQKIKQHHPQLVFLDIDLGKHTSFELLEALSPIQFKVIFVTGHNEFAIKAIKFSALDYLLKPVSGLDLIKAVERVKQTMTTELNYNLLKQQINEQKIAQKIALNLGDKMLLVNTSDIVYLESDGNFTWVHMLNDSKHYASRSLKEFDQLLNTQGFFRTHKSFLINITHIQSYTQKDAYEIVMSNQKKVPLAQRKKTPFLDMMNSLF